MNIILWIIGIGIVVILVYLKGAKGLDVRIANHLRIPIHRYRKYKEWYDEHQKLMQQYGTESREAINYFESILPQIKNMNEWRRYQDFRLKEVLDKFNG